MYSSLSEFIIQPPLFLFITSTFILACMNVIKINYGMWCNLCSIYNIHVVVEYLCFFKLQGLLALVLFVIDYHEVEPNAQIYWFWQKNKLNWIISHFSTVKCDITRHLNEIVWFLSPIINRGLKCFPVRIGPYFTIGCHFATVFPLFAT